MILEKFEILHPFVALQTDTLSNSGLCQRRCAVRPGARGWIPLMRQATQELHLSISRSESEVKEPRQD